MIGSLSFKFQGSTYFQIFQYCPYVLFFDLLLKFWAIFLSIMKNLLFSFAFLNITEKSTETLHQKYQIIFKINNWVKFIIRKSMKEGSESSDSSKNQVNSAPVKLTAPIKNQQSEVSMPALSKPSNYYCSMLVNLESLESPYSKDSNPSKQLLQIKQLKSIKKDKHFLTLEFFEKPQNHEKGANIVDSLKSSSSELQNQMKKVEKSLKQTMTIFREKFLMKYNPKAQEQRYRQVCKKYEGKPVMVWFVPVREAGPKTKYGALSKQLLNLLGIELDSFPLQIKTFKDLELEFWNGETYRMGFLTFISSLRKYISHQINGDISKEQILEESEKIVFNEMKGRNICQFKTRIAIPQSDIIVYEVLEVISQRENTMSEANMMKWRELRDQQDLNAYRYLHKIRNLPETLKPNRFTDICGFKEIDSSEGMTKTREGFEVKQEYNSNEAVKLQEK